MNRKSILKAFWRWFDFLRQSRCQGQWLNTALTQSFSLCLISDRKRDDHNHDELKGRGRCACDPLFNLCHDISTKHRRLYDKYTFQIWSHYLYAFKSYASFSCDKYVWKRRFVSKDFSFYFNCWAKVQETVYFSLRNFLKSNKSLTSHWEIWWGSDLILSCTDFIVEPVHE